MTQLHPFSHRHEHVINMYRTSPDFSTLTTLYLQNNPNIFNPLSSTLLDQPRTPSLYPVPQPSQPSHNHYPKPHIPTNKTMHIATPLVITLGAFASLTMVGI